MNNYLIEILVTRINSHSSVQDTITNLVAIEYIALHSVTNLTEEFITYLIYFQYLCIAMNLPKY